MEKKVAQMGSCKMLVLDEADKLLSQDFSGMLDQVIALLPPDRQILLFSATFPLTVRQFVVCIRLPVTLTTYHLYHVAKMMKELLPVLLQKAGTLSRSMTSSLTTSEFALEHDSTLIHCSLFTRALINLNYPSSNTRTSILARGNHMKST